MLDTYRKIGGLEEERKAPYLVYGRTLKPPSSNRVPVSGKKLGLTQGRQLQGKNNQGLKATNIAFPSQRHHLAPSTT